ncbi:histidine--tRNA ligase, partial [Candidatus Gracilibacteria bacterium]|nr:histidine--tRNA ligase [Candidatus Gracilibacteria bacterium]
ETFIDGDRKLGSIASGGRYEGLTKFLDKKANFSGVGFSMGITRFEDYLFEKLDTEKLVKTTSEYLMINFEETLTESLQLFNKLSESGKKIEFFPESDKLGKQFKYADKKGIKYCILLGKGELERGVYTIKELATGESEEVSL